MTWTVESEEVWRSSRAGIGGGAGEGIDFEIDEQQLPGNVGQD